MLKEKCEFNIRLPCPEVICEKPPTRADIRDLRFKRLTSSKSMPIIPYPIEHYERKITFECKKCGERFGKSGYGKDSEPICPKCRETPEEKIFNQV